MGHRGQLAHLWSYPSDNSLIHRSGTTLAQRNHTAQLNPRRRQAKVLVSDGVLVGDAPYVWYVRTSASYSWASACTRLGSSPLARSASVTTSRTDRRLVRTAIHTSRSCSAGPGYDSVARLVSWTLARGPSMARMTSAREISAAGRANQ